jgi:hypothetical protein
MGKKTLICGDRLSPSMGMIGVNRPQIRLEVPRVAVYGEVLGRIGIDLRTMCSLR